MNEENLSEEILNAAKAASMGTLPTLSKPRYLEKYAAFEVWKKDNNVGCISETVLMAYLYQLSEKQKPSTIWSTYSMLKSTIKMKENVDISKYLQLTAFLKQNSSGYEPTKAKVLKENEVQQFLVEASDIEWLDVKVAMIFGMCGALRGNELVKVTTNDLEHHNKMFLVKIPQTKTKKPRSFTISGKFYETVQRYADLRVPGTPNNRCFVNYKLGKCTKQVIGYHKLSDMPRRVAGFLKLDDLDAYKGHSLRRTSTSILANSGASIERIQAHGGWSSSKVARGYVEESIPHKKETGSKIMNSILSSNGETSSSSGNDQNQNYSQENTNAVSIVVASQGYVQAEDDMHDDELLQEFERVEVMKKKDRNSKMEELNRFVFKECKVKITFK